MKRKEPIILIGGGGHCISCIDIVEKTDRYEILGILDVETKVDTKIGRYSIIGTDDELPNLVRNCPNFLITVGQIISSCVREEIYIKVKQAGGRLPVIISPLAYVSNNALLEEGSIIMHAAVVNSMAEIGKCGIINTKALIEHEVKIGDFCHVSTGSVINGQVNIKSSCFLGSNSVIRNNILIEKNCIIGAGSVVMKDLTESGTYYGNPLRKINNA